MVTMGTAPIKVLHYHHYYYYYLSKQIIWVRSLYTRYISLQCSVSFSLHTNHTLDKLLGSSGFFTTIILCVYRSSWTAHRATQRFRNHQEHLSVVVETTQGGRGCAHHQLPDRAPGGRQAVLGHRLFALQGQQALGLRMVTGDTRCP